jgi:phosphate transport system substrate-binding protein
MMNDDRVDLIIVARKISADEKQYADNEGVTLIETPIALDALDFILNSQNTVNSLSVTQIQDIYLGNIVNWSEVGGANEAIVPYIRNPNSGSQEMMNEIVMKDTGIPDWEVSFSDEEAIGTMIAVYSELRDNIYGICFTPHYYKEYMVPYASEYGIKTLAVNGITPDKNTIGNKTYPFVAEVYASIRSDLDHNSMAYKLYEWLRTKSGKDTIKESGYVPN